MSERKVIRVSEETEAAIREYAEKKTRTDKDGNEVKMSVGDAADLLIGTATARLNALKRYSENKAPQAPGKPRAKKSKKKASAKKAKANGAAEHRAEA